MKNNYYSVAINDLLFVESCLGSANYNPVTIQIQQVAEKLLKSVLEQVTTEIEGLLQSHNLRKIYREIRKFYDINLNERDLGYLKDFYFEAKYPGDDFIVVTRDQCDECLDIMYEVLGEVNKFRKLQNLNVYETTSKKTCTPSNTRGMLYFE